MFTTRVPRLFLGEEVGGGGKNRERSLVCEIRRWKITGRCFFFLSFFFFPPLFSLSNVEKLHSSFNSRGKDEKRPLLVLWNSSMKNYHGDLKRVTRKGGGRKRQSVAKKILKSMSIYYSPFRLINSPFLFANNSRAEEGEEGRKKERKRRRRRKKKKTKKWIATWILRITTPR